MTDDIPADADDTPGGMMTAPSGGTEEGGAPALPLHHSHSRSNPGLSVTGSGGGGGGGAGPSSSSSSTQPQAGSPSSPTAASASTGGRLSSFMSGAASSVVPLDTFDNLRSQYDGVVGFLALVRLCMYKLI